MKNFKIYLMLIIMVMLAACNNPTSSSSSNISSSSSNMVTISGVAIKGPFIDETDITIYKTGISTVNTSSLNKSYISSIDTSVNLTVVGLTAVDSSSAYTVDVELESGDIIRSQIDGYGYNEFDITVTDTTPTTRVYTLYAYKYIDDVDVTINMNALTTIVSEPIDSYNRTSTLTPAIMTAVEDSIYKRLKLDDDMNMYTATYDMDNTKIAGELLAISSVFNMVSDNVIGNYNSFVIPILDSVINIYSVHAYLYYIGSINNLQDPISRFQTNCDVGYNRLNEYMIDNYNVKLYDLSPDVLTSCKAYFDQSSTKDYWDDYINTSNSFDGDSNKIDARYDVYTAAIDNMLEVCDVPSNLYDYYKNGNLTKYIVNMSIEDFVTQYGDISSSDQCPSRF